MYNRCLNSENTLYIVKLEYKISFYIPKKATEKNDIWNLKVSFYIPNKATEKVIMYTLV